MGETLSKTKLEDFQSHEMDFNQKLKISAWDTHPPKNFDYYMGDRFTKISRRHYPEYIRGYLWGYYYDPDYEDRIEIEKDF